MKLKKLLVILIALSMLFTTNAFGSAATVSNANEENLKSQKYYAVESIPKEIKSLVDIENDDPTKIVKSDNLYEITTQKADGTGAVQFFGIPVKYKDDRGNVQLIDTSMVPNGLTRSIFGGYDYKNAANDFTVQYSKSADKGIKMNDAFTMSICNPDDKTSNAGRIEKNTDGEDKFIYPKAFGENTYVEYKNTHTGVKENIVLEKNIGKNTFDFTFKSKTHKLVLSENSSMIYIVDKSNKDNTDYTLSPLYVYDSYKQKSSELSNNKHYTEECHYEINLLDENTYKITLVVSEEYLNNPQTVYPVTIDPFLEFAHGVNDIGDTYVSQNYPNTSYYSAENIRIGGTYKSGVNYGYIRFLHLPSLPTNSEVIDVSLVLTFRPGQTTGAEAQVSSLMDSWNSRSTTYNNMPRTLGQCFAYSQPYENFSYYSFNVTEMVKKWYNGNIPNYGVELSYSEQKNDYNSVYSSDCGDSSKAPKLYFEYNYNKSISNGIYYIKNKCSGQYLDANSNTQVSHNVQQWSFHGGANQQWKVDYQGNGYYKLFNMYTPYDGCCLDVTGDNADVYRNCNNDGSYRLINKGRGNLDKVLDVVESSTSNGADVIQFPWHGGDNQKWHFDSRSSKGVINH